MEKYNCTCLKVIRKKKKHQIRTARSQADADMAEVKVKHRSVFRSNQQNPSAWEWFTFSNNAKPGLKQNS